MADWILNIYNAASSSSLWAPCLPSLLNLYALTGHIVLKRAMCITSDMAGILTGYKASFAKAVSFLKNTNLEYLYCWKCLQWISKKENVGSWKMGPNIFTERLTFAPSYARFLPWNHFTKQGTNPNPLSLSNPTSHFCHFSSLLEQDAESTILSLRAST